jgi:2-dehydropantoate 2-reductase
MSASTIDKQKTILFFGAGAIGGSVAAWLAHSGLPVVAHDLPAIMEKIRADGLTTYRSNDNSSRKTVSVPTITDLREVMEPDVVAISVKNYHLDSVARTVRESFGDRPTILALQNGIANQEILPKYFSKIVYCVICYNAWVDEPGVIGYQKKGPLVFGTPGNEYPKETERIAALFNRGVETLVSTRFQDVAHSKMIVNLTNSVTTLVGHGFRPISDAVVYQKLMTNITYEGTLIARAAGFKECTLGDMPPWRLFFLGAKLPRIITKPLFEKNLKKMVMSSMSQDIIQRGGKESELETINGYVVRLAEKHGVKAPYNRAIYNLCKKEFAKPEFHPLDVREVWKAVAPELRK